MVRQVLVDDWIRFMTFQTDELVALGFEEEVESEDIEGTGESEDG